MSYLNINTILATLTSFFAYFIMSAILSPLGIISGSLADHYNISLAQAVATFSYLTSGVLIGSILSIFANPRLGSRKVILLVSPFLLCVFLALRILDSASMLPLLFVLIGTCCGMLLSTGAIVLTALYKEQHRPSALLLTDSFYSFAGFSTAPLAAWVLASSMHWSIVYTIAFVVTFFVAVVAIFTTYPPEMKAPELQEGQNQSWPLAVYLLGSALVIYLIAFVFIYTWIPSYATEYFGVSPSDAANLVSRFFRGLFFGQLVMFVLALRVDVRVLVLCTCAVSSLLTFGLWAPEFTSDLSWLVLLLGLFAGGMLKCVIALGARVVDYPTSRLMGFYMFCMAVGSSIGPALGAFIVDQTNIQAAIISISMAMTLVLTLLLVTVLLSRKTFARSARTV